MSAIKAQYRTDYARAGTILRRILSAVMLFNNVSYEYQGNGFSINSDVHSGN